MKFIFKCFSAGVGKENVISCKSFTTYTMQKYARKWQLQKQKDSEKSRLNLESFQICT